MGKLATDGLRIHSLHEATNLLGVSRPTLTRVIMTSGIDPIPIGKRSLGLTDTNIAELRIALLAEGFEVQS